MKIEKRFLLLNGALAVATMGSGLAGMTLHCRWLVDLATALLCLWLQVIILALGTLALLSQSAVIAGRRLFYSRLALVVILAAVVGAITWVQVISLARAWRHYHFIHH